MYDWVIFYHDGSEYSSLDGSPWDAPRTGVLAIFVKDERERPDGRGYYPVYHQDYYTFHACGESWASHNLIGLADYLVMEKYPLVLRGYEIPKYTFSMGALSRRLPHGGKPNG